MRNQSDALQDVETLQVRRGEERLSTREERLSISRADGLAPAACAVAARSLRRVAIHCHAQRVRVKFALRAERHMRQRRRDALPCASYQGLAGNVGSDGGGATLRFVDRCCRARSQWIRRVTTWNVALACSDAG